MHEIVHCTKYTTLYNTILGLLHYTTLYYTILYKTTLYRPTSLFIGLLHYDTILCYTILGLLHYTPLYYATLYSTILCYTIYFTFCREHRVVFTTEHKELSSLLNIKS